ncbi:MAG TPA: FliA/WhiG family RNA polymerase sigma factor [Candidatus Limnocylindrales bacterium]
MFDRQFLPPFHASAPIDGSVVARSVPSIFADSRTGQLIDPLVKSSGVLDGEPGSYVDGGPPDAPPSDPHDSVVDEVVAGAQDGQMVNPDAPVAMLEDTTAVAEAVELPVEADPEAAREAAPEAPDLRGYTAYGNIPTPGLGLSRDELVTRYAHLVKYVVGRLGVSVPGLFDHEDAMQAGVLGLLRAIDAYKPEAAASFESYAILRIRGSILDAVRSLDTVGRAGREAARAIQGAIRDLQHEQGRSPTESEIAARLNMTVARYRERLQAASVVTISLDEHDSRDGDDDSVMLADQAPDPNAVDPADEAARRDAIAGLIAEIGRLSERPRMVLALYYQDEMTFKEIGQVLGVTESRVCQIHTEAILALRSRLVDPDVAARLGRRRARS